jgi:hypothetical protein
MSHTTEFSSIVLDGHCDSVNAVKFDADLSMLLSGGKLIVCLPIYRLFTFHWQTTPDE